MAYTLVMMFVFVFTTMADAWTDWTVDRKLFVPRNTWHKAKRVRLYSTPSLVVSYWALNQNAVSIVIMALFVLFLWKLWVDTEKSTRNGSLDWCSGLNVTNMLLFISLLYIEAQSLEGSNYMMNYLQNPWNWVYFLLSVFGFLVLWMEIQIHNTSTRTAVAGCTIVLLSVIKEGIDELLAAAGSSGFPFDPRGGDVMDVITSTLGVLLAIVVAYRWRVRGHRSH